MAYNEKDGRAIEIYDKKTNYGLDNFEEKYDLLGIVAGFNTKKCDRY